MSTRKIRELVLVGFIGTSLFGLTACSPDVPVESSTVDTSALTGKVTSQAEGAM